MATFNKRYGWKWNEYERASRQESLANSRRRAEKVAAQIPLVKEHAPEYLIRAQAINSDARELIAALESVELRKTRRRKYQKLSPEEVDILLSRFQEVVLKWQTMTSVSRYQKLVRDANKETRRENARIRELNREVMEELNRRAALHEEYFSKLSKELEELFQSPARIENET